MKTCSKCKEDLSIDNFSKCKSNKDGLQHKCKNCTKLYTISYKHKKVKSDKIRYKMNKKQINNKAKIYYKKNAEKIKLKVKEYALNNKDKVNSNKRQYYYKNKTKLKAQNYKRKKQRLLNDIHFKLGEILRNRLRCALKCNSKTGSAVRDLGCTIEQLKVHLESQFQPGMNWSNHSLHGWHIDHIKPLASFDLTDPVQFKQACHYTNLQPLWAVDNIRKRDKI